MYDSRVMAGPVDRSVSFDPDLVGVTEVFHASFTEHRYPLHCHDTWTVLLVDDGCITYDLDHRSRLADRPRVTVLPPHVAHDGRSAEPGRSFRKRVLYLDRQLLGEDLIGRAVDRSAIDDRSLRRAIGTLHESFARPVDDLEREALLAEVVATIGGRLRAAPGPPRRERPPSSEAAEALRAELDDDPFRRHRLNDSADRLGWSVAHLARSFRRAYGLPPHRYLIAKRIDEARRQLLAGRPPAEVATGVGFHDQAHLHRHFRAHLGTTPGRFRVGAGAGAAGSAGRRPGRGQAKSILG